MHLLHLPIEEVILTINILPSKEFKLNSYKNNNIVIIKKQHWLYYADIMAV